MSHELIYTSAQSGLSAGSKGYCTVAATPGMSKQLSDLLESLSGYRHLVPPATPGSERNPVNFAHYRVSVGGTPMSILSRVADAGLDYSGRSNKLAHHIALDSHELLGSGPASVISNSVHRATWDAEPHQLAVRNVVSAEELGSRVCSAWAAITGDAGWAGVVAESVGNAKKTGYILFEPGTNVLPLLVEVERLLDDPWSFTFSTFYTSLPPGVKCQWRCVPNGSEEGKRARIRSVTVIDLSMQGVPKSSALVEAARGGKRPKQERSWSGTEPTGPNDFVLPEASAENSEIIPSSDLVLRDARYDPVPPALDDPSTAPPPLRIDRDNVVQVEHESGTNQAVLICLIGVGVVLLVGILSAMLANGVANDGAKETNSRIVFNEDEPSLLDTGTERNSDLQDRGLLNASNVDVDHPSTTTKAAASDDQPDKPIELVVKTGQTLKPEPAQSALEQQMARLKVLGTQLASLWDDDNYWLAQQQVASIRNELTSELNCAEAIPKLDEADRLDAYLAERLRRESPNRVSSHFGVAEGIQIVGGSAENFEFIVDWPDIKLITNGGAPRDIGSIRSDDSALYVEGITTYPFLKVCGLRFKDSRGTVIRNIGQLQRFTLDPQVATKKVVVALPPQRIQLVAKGISINGEPMSPTELDFSESKTLTFSYEVRSQPYTIRTSYERHETSLTFTREIGVMGIRFVKLKQFKKLLNNYAELQDAIEFVESSIKSLNDQPIYKDFQKSKNESQGYALLVRAGVVKQLGKLLKTFDSERQKLIETFNQDSSVFHSRLRQEQKVLIDGTNKTLEEALSQLKAQKLGIPDEVLGSQNSNASIPFELRLVRTVVDETGRTDSIPIAVLANAGEDM